MTDNQGRPGADARPSDSDHATERTFAPSVSRAELAEFRDGLHVPDDAGAWADGLEAILRRIPERWGRWIRCDAGWSPLVVKCDRALAQITPDYEVQQVKEKFGVLQFYFAVPNEELACCAQFRAAHPRPPRGATVEELQRWREAVQRHQATAEHAEQVRLAEPAAWRDRMDQMHAVVRGFEAESARTCEVCGAPGTLMARDHIVKTVCDTCAAEGGFGPWPEDRA